MILSLDNLSDNEFELYKGLDTYKGTKEEIEHELNANGVFEKYRIIHKQYFQLCDTTTDDKIKIEALKRLTFLNWYSILEPGCFTGIEELDHTTISKSYAILNTCLQENKIDKEFKWMLSYYSCWDFIILMFSENKLDSLTDFVKNVDTSILYVPKQLLPKGSMYNRGQMGFYWKSCSVEINETK